MNGLLVSALIHEWFIGRLWCYWFVNQIGLLFNDLADRLIMTVDGLVHGLIVWLLMSCCERFDRTQDPSTWAAYTDRAGKLWKWWFQNVSNTICALDYWALLDSWVADCYALLDSWVAEYWVFLDCALAAEGCLALELLTAECYLLRPCWVLSVTASVHMLTISICYLWVCS